MIQYSLILIAAVVIGAFFAIWTIQRPQEIGLVKALGASNAYLLKDSPGQALLLLGSGTLIGMLVALWLGQFLMETGRPLRWSAPPAPASPACSRSAAGCAHRPVAGYSSTAAAGRSSSCWHASATSTRLRHS